jgi:hypothetical protein
MSKRSGFRRRIASSTNPGGITVVVPWSTGVEEEVLTLTPSVTNTTGRACDVLTVTDYTTAGNYAITAAAIAGGIITRDPNGSARTDTLPLGTALDTELPDLRNGGAVTCYYINTANAAEAITLAANTGVTISNVDQTIAQSEAALLVLQKTATATYVCYILGA